MEIGISIKQRLFQIAEIIHLRVFGHAMSDEMRKFLGNLSWSFFGGIIAAGIMFSVNILAGRWLGPEEYGKYNLIFLMAQIFLIPMIAGMDVSVSRSIAKVNGEYSKISNLISSSVIVVIFTAAVFSVIFFVARESFADFFSASVGMVTVAILLGLTILLKMLFDGAMKGLHLFRFQAIARIIEGIAGITIFLATFFLLRSHLALVFSVAISAVLVSLMYALKIRNFFSVFDFGSVRELFRYAKFVIIGSIVALVLGYGDRYIVNRYLGIEELGIYSAYYTATILVVGQFIAMFSNVFFPMIAKAEKKIEIIKKIDKLLVIGILPTIVTVFIIGCIIVKLFGNAYMLQSTTLILFGVVAALQFFASFYANIVNVHSEMTYFLGLSFFAVRTCVYVVYMFILIAMNVVTIPAILIGLIMNYIIDIFNLRYIIKKYS